MMKFRAIFFALFLFSSNAYSVWWFPFFSGETEIKKALTSYRFSPDINTNKEFADEIRARYGNHIADKLINMHAYLVHGNGKIDTDTVLWFIKEFKLSAKSKTNEYFYVPLFDIHSSRNNSSHHLLLNMILSRVYPDFTVKILFNNQDHLDSFKYFFSENNYERPKRVLSIGFKIKDSEFLDRIVDQIYFKIFTQKLYHTDPNTMKQDTYVLNIAGHGFPGSDVLAGEVLKDHATGAPVAQEIHYKDIVAKLKPHLFLDNRSVINLVTCNSASKGEPQIQKTTEEMKELFIKGRLINEFNHGLSEKDTFLYKFSNEIFMQRRAWNGSVRGWFGWISLLPRKTYVRDAEDPTKLIVEERYSVGIENSSGREVMFDKNELTKYYARSDFGYNP